MRDRYNLNLLPGMSEDGVEYGALCYCDREVTVLEVAFCRPVL